ncbi:MAG: peptidylprolyl isomerase [archaeon]
MANPVKGDFVSVSYVGKIVETGEVFDLTDEARARQAGLYSEQVIYGPMTVRIGSGHMLAGLEDAVVQMAPGETRVVRISSDRAFGARDPSKIQTVPDKVFKEQKPVVGMIVNIQGLMGKVQSVSGGRVVLDFNHPLAGKEVEYEFTLEKVVTALNEKFAGILRLHAHKGQDAKFSLSGDVAEVILPPANPMPEGVMTEIFEESKEGVPEIKKVKFTYIFE